MQVKTKNRIVSALAVVLVVFLWYQFLYSSMESKASKANTAAHDADTQAKTLKQTLDGATNAKGGKKVSDIPEADLTAALPADAAESAFFRSLDQLRITSGANWQSVSPAQAVAGTEVATVSVSIVVQGTEDQLAKYIAGLSAMKRIFVTDTVAIAGGASTTADAGNTGGGGALFNSPLLSLNIAGRIFSQPAAVAPTVTGTSGAGGTTTPVTGAPAPTGGSSASGTVNG